MALDVIAHLSAPSSGVLQFTGLTLTSYALVRMILNGITVTTDDTEVALRFIIGGSEISTGYRYSGLGHIIDSAGSGTDTSTSDDRLNITGDLSGEAVGNAAGRSLSAVIDIPAPGIASVNRFAFMQAVWEHGGTGRLHMARHGGQVLNTGAIDGFKVLGDSNLVAGKATLLGFS